MASLPQTRGYHKHQDQKRESEDSTSSSDISIPNMADTPPTRQLDFYQAMADFRQMFPNMEEEVIEAVLRANNGAVDPTIEQLLAMNVDSDGGLGTSVEVPPALAPRALQPKINIPSGFLLDSSTSSDEEDLPPSYNEYTKSIAKGSPKVSETASPAAKSGATATSTPPLERPARPAAVAGNLLDMDEEDLEWQLQGATGYTPSTADSEATNEKRVMASVLDDDFNPSPPAPPMPPKMTLLQHDYTPRHRPPMAEPGFRPPPKRVYKNWNPPLLGNLPDDFLRIIITPKELPQPKPVPVPVHTCGLHGHYPQNMPLTHPHTCQPALQPHHHRGQLTRSMTAPTRSSGSPQSSRSPQSTRAAVAGGIKSPNQGSLSPVHRSRSAKLSRSASAAQPNPHIHATMGTRTLVASHGSEELDSGTIQLKIAENERKQSSASNPEQAQILADEHLALMMQNEEFLTVLRHDEDFMRTLERDRMNATAFERPESPELDHNRPHKDQIEGYGQDHQEELGAFPFAQPVPGSDNAEFRRQLHNMGGSSRKKFAALAKKFFTRKKKKSPRQFLKDSVAPSTANLLEEEDDEEESPGSRGDGHAAAANASVPTHMTVQRPMYHPDTIITHHSPHPYDMV